jgi:uncharacterized DUF497 family protein
MKPFNWNKDKNQQLQEQRGITFEEIAQAIEQGNLLDVIKHYNPDKYPNQKILALR